MKRIAAAAALLTLLGGGAAMAQGLPPGYAWHSGWPAYVAQQQAELNARNALARNANRANGERTAVTQNERTPSVPLAANPGSNRLGS